MANEAIVNQNTSGLATAVVEVWRSIPLGVPDALAFGDRLILPVRRPSASTPNPLIVSLNRGADYFAVCEDAEIDQALIQATHAEEQILADFEDVVDWKTETDEGRPSHLLTSSVRFEQFARQVFQLWQCAGLLLAYADGYESGQSYFHHPLDVTRRQRRAERERQTFRSKAFPFQVARTR